MDYAWGSCFLFDYWDTGIRFLLEGLDGVGAQAWVSCRPGFTAHSASHSFLDWVI